MGSPIKTSHTMITTFLALSLSALMVGTGRNTTGWDTASSSARSRSPRTMQILCSFHDGYIVEIDRVAFNYWIKSMLLELYTPDVDAKVPWGNQFWMGAVTEEHHSDHHNGNWMWPHFNASVDWFDWGKGEPNDFHRQNCMTYMEYRDPFWPAARDYFWNDWGCD